MIPETEKFKKSPHILTAVKNIPIDSLRLESDGRKWKHAASERKCLLRALADFANADGTRIFPTIKRLSDNIGWSRRKTCYVLDELTALNVTERTGRKGQRGPAIRRIVSESPKFNPVGVQDSTLGVQDSTSQSAIASALETAPSYRPNIPPPPTAEKKSGDGGKVSLEKQADKEKTGQEENLKSLFNGIEDRFLSETELTIVLSEKHRQSIVATLKEVKPSPSRDELNAAIGNAIRRDGGSWEGIKIPTVLANKFVECLEIHLRQISVRREQRERDERAIQMAFATAQPTETEKLIKIQDAEREREKQAIAELEKTPYAF